MNLLHTCYSLHIFLEFFQNIFVFELNFGHFFSTSLFFFLFLFIKQFLFKIIISLVLVLNCNNYYQNKINNQINYSLPPSDEICESKGDSHDSSDHINQNISEEQTFIQLNIGLLLFFTVYSDC